MPTYIQMVFTIGLLLCCANTLQGAEPASISGRIEWQGELPADDVAANLAIDEQSNGVSGVLVYVTSGVPDEDATAGKKIPVDLSMKSGFEPRIVVATPWDTIAVNVVDRGSPVFPVSGQSPINEFDLQTGAYLFDFKEPKLYPRQLCCAVNSDAVCHVLVLKHRFVAITDAEGRFSLSSVSPGRVTLRAWHERCGYIKAWNGRKDRDGVVDVEHGQAIELAPLSIDLSMID